MAASPVATGRPSEVEDDGSQRRRAVVIAVAAADGPGLSLPASSCSGEGVALLDDHAGAGDSFDADGRPRGPASALWRVVGAVLVLAALAAAGYAGLCYAGAAWRSLAAREAEDDERGGRRTSFLLPLYPKARRGGGSPENSTAATLPLAGNAFPERLYYTIVSIGNPPRPYFLDVDTGSDLTWIQCGAPCKSCAKGAHPLYRPAPGNRVPASDPLCERVQSNSSQCDYDISYADGSSSLGVYQRDHMQLITEDGARENLDIVFGCGHDQQGNLLASLENTDGVLGLSNREISLPAQLASRGIISSVFGHCTTTDPSGGGYLFLGDNYVPKWGMTWVPIRNGPAHNIHRARIHQVNHGDQQLSVQGKLTQVIFDSGTTYAYFPREAYINLIAAMKDASPRFVQDDSDKTLPFCMKADFPVRSVDDVKHFFKPLSLQFEKRLFFFSRIFTVPPENYLIMSDKGNVCLGVLDGTKLGYDSEIIVGDVFLRGKLVVYDNDENQIGWAESDCTNPRKQSIFPFPLRRALRNQFL